MDIHTLRETAPWQWPASAGQTLRRALQDRSTALDDRTAAAELAGEYCVIDDELVESLLAILQSPDEPEELRARAAISIGPALEGAEEEGFDNESPISDPPITEDTFRRAVDTLRNVYADEKNPKEVRRRALEAAVRSPQNWHGDAIRAAYTAGDREWMLTAVFGMGYIPGFHREIVESLDNLDPEIRREAITAAGEQEVRSAWPRIEQILRSPTADKDLRLAAIEAATYINPEAAAPIFAGLGDSDDEDIAEAADEALSMADALSGDFDDDHPDDEEDEEDA